MTQPQEHQLDSETYNAIHRALLTGLLGNVGTKGEAHEYNGQRGLRFAVFPGSGLFKKQPPWLVAAELVETTRLYARTVARIQEKWIEQAAEHLTQKEYWEPQWKREWSDVVAYEKVTLYGLTLVAKRLVPFGPIDPKQAREIFIQGALVRGEYRTDAPFFRHNQKLMAEIAELETKSRKHDVLVDEKARFAFYEARLPQGIYNGQRFEHWRRQIERKNPKVLFMSQRDLMQHGAQGVTAVQFPDVIQLGELKLPLSYHLEPGHPLDGVTVTIPLAVLNQVPTERFQWLVPGLLLEKATELIRTLPKAMRVNFVPVPEHAQRAVDELKFAEGRLLEQLAWQLGKQTGTPIPPDSWHPEQLPEYLHMNFKVIDASGKQLAMGRDLEQIRQKLAEQVRKNFALLPPGPFNREHLQQWDFGDLPQRVEIQHYGMTLVGYPALVEMPGTAAEPSACCNVALRLFDSPEAAAAHMRGGLRRLFMLQMPEELKWVRANLPGFEQMSLQYATRGNGANLKEDLVTAIADQAFIGDRPEVRTQMEYELRLDWGWNRLSPVTSEVCELTGQILQTYHGIAMELAEGHGPLWNAALTDIQRQLAALMPKGFLTGTPYAWLKQLPRYLKGIQIRLHRLANFGFTKDAAAIAQVAPLWDQYRQRLAEHQQQGVYDPELQQYRWMIEELRVSLFAQELKTTVPVSVKKLEAQWERCK